MSIIVPMLLIAGLSIVFIQIFTDINEFQIIEANTVYYKNVSNPKPEISNETLTNSIKIRFNEVFFSEYQSLNSRNSLKTQRDLKFHQFYINFMSSHVGRLSDSSLFVDSNSSTVQMLSVKNFQKISEQPISSIGVYSLNEDRLFGVMNKPQPGTRQEWQTCFNHIIDGAIEVYDVNEEKNVMSVGLHNRLAETLIIRHYKQLQCNHSTAIDYVGLARQYCVNSDQQLFMKSQAYDMCKPLLEEDSEIDEDQDAQQKILLEKTKNLDNERVEGSIEINNQKNLQDEEEQLYEEIQVADIIEAAYNEKEAKKEAETANNENSNKQNEKGSVSKIYHRFFNFNQIASTQDLIVFSTLEDKGQLFYVYRTQDGEWRGDTILYRTLEYELFYNQGLKFYVDSESSELQLIITDMIGGSETMYSCISGIRFTKGRDIKNMTYFKANYEYEGKSTENNNEDSIIEPDVMYLTPIFQLMKTNMTHEYRQVEFNSKQPFPDTIFYLNPEQQILTMVILHKYIFLLHIANNYIHGSRLPNFEDQSFKIKTTTTSQDGNYYGFLCYNKKKYRVYIINTDFWDENDLNFYLVDFDYSLNTDSAQIKDLHLMKNMDNEMQIMLLLDSGEVASYTVQFGSTFFGNFYELIEDDYFFIITTPVLIFLLFRLRKYFDRIRNNNRVNVNINIRRNM